MKYEEFVKKSDELIEKARATEDPEEKANLHKDWWEAAVDCVNTELSGEITLADGRIVNIPEI